MRRLARLALVALIGLIACGSAATTPERGPTAAPPTPIPSPTIVATSTSTATTTPTLVPPPPTATATATPVPTMTPVTPSPTVTPVAATPMPATPTPPPPTLTPPTATSPPTPTSDRGAAVAQQITSYLSENFGIPGATTSWYPYIGPIAVSGATVTVATSAPATAAGKGIASSICGAVSGFVYAIPNRGLGLSQVKVLADDGSALIFRQNVSGPCN